MPPIQDIRLYHILHVDRLKSVLADGFLWCDREVIERAPDGTTIGMNAIKSRRLNELKLESHPELFVGDCVPFYFCPRSIMLYLIYQGNHADLDYKGGQHSIIHLELELSTVVKWASQNDRRWAFSLGNAGSRYFEDRANLDHLNEIDWDAVKAKKWINCKEGKQAEFLVENRLSSNLITRIGVLSSNIATEVNNILDEVEHKPSVELMPSWYY